MNTNTQEPNNLPLSKVSEVKSLAQDFKGVVTLRRRLLITVIPAVLLPLVVASALGYTITERRAKTQILEQFKTNAVTASTTISTFIRHSFDTVDLVGVNPEVAKAMKAASNQAQKDN
ncbi:MAG: hypothetical protein ACRC06_00985 [Waterburya sp.]